MKNEFKGVFREDFGDQSHIPRWKTLPKCCTYLNKSIDSILKKDIERDCHKNLKFIEDFPIQSPFMLSHFLNRTFHSYVKTHNPQHTDINTHTQNTKLLNQVHWILFWCQSHVDKPIKSGFKGNSGVRSTHQAATKLFNFHFLFKAFSCLHPFCVGIVTITLLKIIFSFRICEKTTGKSLKHRKGVKSQHGTLFIPFCISYFKLHKQSSFSFHIIFLSCFSSGSSTLNKNEYSAATSRAGINDLNFIRMRLN